MINIIIASLKKIFHCLFFQEKAAKKSFKKKLTLLTFSLFIWLFY